MICLTVQLSPISSAVRGMRDLLQDSFLGREQAGADPALEREGGFPSGLQHSAWSVRVLSKAAVPLQGCLGLENMRKDP